MTKKINICFQYNLIDENFHFFTDYIDEIFFSLDFENTLIDLFHTWYTENKLSKVYCKIPLGKSIIYELEFFLEFQIKLLFFLYSFSNHDKIINIKYSKNFEQISVVKDLFSRLNIHYSLKTVEECPVMVSKITYIPKENKIKRFVKSFIVFLNNAVTLPSQKRIFIQNSEQVKNLKKELNFNYVIDSIFLEKNFFSSPKFFSNKRFVSDRVYFKPAPKIKDNNIMEMVQWLIEFYYYKHEESIIKECDYIIKEFKKYNIKSILLMIEITRTSIIMMEYIKSIGGEVYLYNHGLRNFNSKILKFLLPDINYIFSWSDIESSCYKKLNPDIDVIKLGNSNYFSKDNIINNFLRKKITDFKIIVLPFFSGSNIKIELDNLRDIVESLLLIIDKSNIKIKLHPGRANLSFFHNFFQDLIPFENIFKNEKIDLLIEECDIVIGPHSTAIYDTLFKNKYYIVNELFDKKYGDIELISSLGLPTFMSPKQELGKIIEDIKNGLYPSHKSLLKRMVYDTRNTNKVLLDNLNGTKDG